jgi:hypothetical protein
MKCAARGPGRAATDRTHQHCASAALRGRLDVGGRARTILWNTRAVHMQPAHARAQRVRSRRACTPPNGAAVGSRHARRARCERGRVRCAVAVRALAMRRALTVYAASYIGARAHARKQACGRHTILACMFVCMQAYACGPCACGHGTWCACVHAHAHSHAHAYTPQHFCVCMRAWHER